MDAADDSGDVQAELAAAAAEVSAQLRLEREARQCAVCLLKERETVLLPCRHSVMCSTCTQHVQHSSGRCPLCRGAIESSLRVYN